MLCWRRKSRSIYQFGGRAYRTLHTARLELKPDMSIDEINHGQRINYNGVYGTVVGKRSTRKRQSVLAKMDNGFTLKLDPQTLSVRLPQAGASQQQLASAFAPQQ